MIRRWSLSLMVAVVALAVGASAASAAIPMQLPFPVGQVWQANGPHPYNGSSGVRNSLDFGRTDGSTGTVVAAAAGTVSMVRNCGGGYEIRIGHAGGWQTGYYHLSSVSVAQGAQVAMGQPIGATGQGCGAATFRHVHFSIRQNGADVNADGLNIGGNTVHAKNYNYGGWWTRNSDGAKVTEDVGGDARCCLTSYAVDAGGGVTEGSFISAPDGRVYRVAGGAPIYVSSWNAFGGPQPTTSVSNEQLAAMRPVPADGTFISSTATGRAYRIAGGAPIYVSSWNAVGGPQRTVGIDQWALDNIDNPYAHLRRYPADGTFISSTGTGRVYRTAGGAPVYVSSWNAVGGPQPTTAIDQWALDNIDDPNAHLRRYPVDGSFISSTATGRVYRMAGGAPIYVSAWDAVGGPQPSTGIDQWALDNTGDPQAHLLPYPADGTFISSSATGRVYRVAGGAPIYVSSWNAVGGPQPTTGVDQWALDNIDDPNAHLRGYPADGTFINSTATGRVYRVAGGAPVYVSSWDIFGAPQSSTGVDQWALENASDPHAHLRALPADGTRLQGLPSQTLVEIVSGRRRMSAEGSGAVAVNDDSLQAFRAWQPPTATRAPSVEGPGIVGTEHRCVPGAWEDFDTASVVWRRNGEDINGATQRTYTAVTADSGARLSCAERATNIVGTSEERSGEILVRTPRGTSDDSSDVGVSVAFGARYTRTPRVTVRVVAPTGTATISLSNDGGFTSASTVAVREDGLYSWQLDAEGPERLPKRVYVRFGRSSQTYSDDIILDTTEPRVQRASVESLATRGRASTAGARRRYRLRISATDLTSGLARLQSRASRRGRISSRAFARRLTIRAARRPAYVRVADGAGNWSSWRRINRRGSVVRASTFGQRAGEG